MYKDNPDDKVLTVTFMDDEDALGLIESINFSEYTAGSALIAVNSVINMDILTSPEQDELVHAIIDQYMEGHAR